MIDRLIRSVLISRPVMAVKRGLRDLSWRWMRPGRGTRNPELPERRRKLLFICYGNICRSAVAAILGRRLLQERGIRDVTCSSAGLRARDGKRSPEPAVLAAAAAVGVDLEDHRARLISEEMVRESDLVFAMEPWQLEELRERWPEHRHRFFLLPLLDADLSGRAGGYDRYNLEDPYGRTGFEFRRCFRRLDRMVRNVLSALYGPPP